MEISPYGRWFSQKMRINTIGYLAICINFAPDLPHKRSTLTDLLHPFSLEFIPPFHFLFKRSSSFIIPFISDIFS